MILLSREQTLVVILLFIAVVRVDAWGFYGHRLINQQAVYSLPWPLQQVFLPHIERLSRHAVDPDKRRYASTEEAFQHYFDTEKWQQYLSDSDRSYNRADMLRCLPSLQLISGGDTMDVFRQDTLFTRLLDSLPRYFSGSSWPTIYGVVVDTMASHGLLPITLTKWYYKLVRAFEKGEINLILKVAADLGHYIADAHVPLHTTENYNGQKTDQLGIHAFWETHVPEWMAEREFDLVSGVAQVISHMEGRSWAIVRDSYSNVDRVLGIERQVRNLIPEDQQVCSMHRGTQEVMAPCPVLIERYHEALDGMVENQMKKAIHTIASFWWSAYVEAGQPHLEMMQSKATGRLEVVEDGEIATSGGRCE